MKNLPILLTTLAAILAFTLQAQVAINNDGDDADPNSVLDVRDASDNPAFFIEAATGNVAVHNSVPAAVDIFSSYATGTNWAINGYSVNAPAVFGGSTGTGPGVFGSSSGSGKGVYGSANGGFGDGIYGIANKSISNAIKGINFHNAPADSSVVAISGAAGIIGTSTTSISLLDQQSAIIGTGNGTGGIGIAGFLWDGSTSNDEMAGYFSADFDGDIDTDDGPFVLLAGNWSANAQFGVYASVPEQSDDVVAVTGVYTGGGDYDAIGVLGDATSTNNNYGYGVRGNGNYMGVRGNGGTVGVYGSGSYGVYGSGSYGVYGSGNYGVYGSGSLYGVYADGNMGASGTKSFMIDYPLDPENKYLKHFSIESDQVLLQYRGVETFNGNGEVIVELPVYYSTINKNASYQLTAIGAAMPNLYIKRKVDNTNTFVIAGGISGKEVSWLVISERNDPYLQQNPDKRKTIVDKGEKRGKYLMPELYGQPEEKGIDWKRDERDDKNNVLKVNKPSLKANKSVKKENISIEKKDK